jgi:hypothetical protein
LRQQRRLQLQWIEIACSRGGSCRRNEELQVVAATPSARELQVVAAATSARKLQVVQQ